VLPEDHETHFRRIVRDCRWNLLGCRGRRTGNSEQYKAQISRQVAIIATQPAKVSAKLLTAGIQLNSRPQVEITVLNADNQPVPAKQDWQFDISIQFPSGKPATTTAWIKKGDSSGQFDFLADEAGLVSVNVLPALRGVRADKIDLIVRRPQKAKKRKSAKTSSFSGLAVPFSNGPHAGPARLVLAGFTAIPDPDSNPQNDAQSAPNAPVLHISVSDLGGSYFANGKDAACEC